MPLDTVAARTRRRRLPSVDVPQTVENDELRRSIEALKEHIRMYEGDSGAPKERFVTVEELELAGLIGTKVQGNFALIDQVLGGTVAQGQQSAQKIVFEGEGFGSGGGVELLRDLRDTSVGGVKPGSVLYYQNGVWSYVDIGKIDNEFEVAQTFYNCITFSDIDATTTGTWCLESDSTYAPDGRSGTALTFTQTGLEGLSIRANNPVRIYQGTMAQDTPLVILGYEGINQQFRVFKISEGMADDEAVTPGGGAGFYVDYEGLPNSPDNTLHFGSDKPSAAGTIFHIGERGEFRIEDTLNHGASLTSINHPFQIGPTTSLNLRAGRNEIQAVNNGAQTELQIQPYGGGVSFFESDFASDYHNFNIYLGKSGTTSGRFYLTSNSSNLNSFMYYGNASGNDLIWTCGFTTENLDITAWDEVLFSNGQQVSWGNFDMSDAAQFKYGAVANQFATTFVDTTHWNITGLTTELYVDNDIHTAGDLKVDGTFIQFNSDATDPPTEDVTLEVYRGGVAGTVAIRWNETSDKWEFTNDGSTYNDIGGGSGSQTPWTSDIDGGGFGLDNIDRLEIQASGVATDTATFTHDGTDFDTTFANTTDWTIDGLTGAVVLGEYGVTDGRLRVEHDADPPSLTTTADDGILIGEFTATSVATHAVINRTGINFFKGDGAGNRTGTGVFVGIMSYVPSGWNLIFGSTSNSGTISFAGGGEVGVRDGGTFRVYNTADDDYAEFQHDGTDFNTSFTAAAGTTDWNITGLAGFNVGNYNFDVDQTVGAGQDNYVLTYDDALGTIQLEAATGGGGGISNVVEDLTPQLGGQLDVNGQALGDGTLELLTFTETGSAVNHINITNAITATGPTIGAAGDDANIDLVLAAKGTGNIDLGNFTFDADQTVGAGQDNYVLTYDNAGGTIQLEESIYDIGFFYSGKPTNSQEVFRMESVRAWTHPDPGTGSTGEARVASTGNVAFSVRRNGTQYATVTFNISAAGTWAFDAAADENFAAGDTLTVLAPATADATLEDIAIFLKGLR